MKNILQKFKYLFMIFLMIISNNVTAKIEDQMNLEKQISELHLKSTPKRIVTLSVSVMESLVILGAKPAGISVTASGKIPEYLSDKMKDIERVGVAANPSLERIKNLNPDLIIIDRVYEDNRAIIGKLKEITPSVLIVRPENYQETMKNLQLFGKLLNKEPEANDYIKKFYFSLKNTQEFSKKQNTSVLAIFVSNNNVWAWTNKSFLASLLAEIKVDYSYKGEGDKNYQDIIQLNSEKILELDPEQIIVFDDPGKNIIAFLEKNVAWKSLKAVQNKKIHIVDRDIWSRSRGPMAAGMIVKDMGNVLK